MLDDLKLIHDRDSEDAIGVAAKQWQQLTYDYEVDLPEFGEISNIVLAGMGGSSFPGVYLKSWPGTLAPMEIIRDYTLPEYVNAKTLFISSSHSGNTEETLSALRQAEEKGAQIVVISSGGKLAERAEEKAYPLFRIPGGIQPRMCSFYFLAAFMQILEPLGLVPQGSRQELMEVSEWLKGEIDDLLAEVPTAGNPAKQLALELIGKSVVVYSGPKLFPAANKFKICLNESAKNIAWVNQYPEFNHNEFIGWSSHPEQKPYAVVEFRSTLENERVQKRFEISERLLSGKRPQPEVIVPKGDTVIRQLLWSSNFGDFTSLYVAVLNGVDPTPVELVEKLKQLLG
ncbi:MAG TPA: bifunctional phosphoglucose/phosphomannose isomerase [Candidatus Saccharimonadales bacterium]|nr:bifunctional phosphoglucose/phosphomannose isomerase [Candidatus Saccharimonadales bacterium]